MKGKRTGNLVILLVQNNKKELKSLMNNVQEVFPDDTVVGVDSPQKALSYADSSKVDVCFADVEMKTGNGFVLTEELRNRNKNICVNLMASGTDYAIDAWRHHINDYILKPITTDSIRHTISK